MRVIQENDITQCMPCEISKITCLYTELPFVNNQLLFRSVAEACELRRKLGQDSYVVAPATAKKWLSSSDRSSVIKVKVGKEYRQAWLYQYGVCYRVKTTVELQNVLASLHQQVIDVCAGTGVSTDLFEDAYLFDKNPIMVNFLSEKYSNLDS